ncbi:4Fe-4S binding protein [Deltaproteobacteria bacterium OttesenSCG-928-K17]|nr:4Fe-4S binding protein [Deltaproteobacteria bacterium OttesenSCG-928-K17]
MIKALVDNIKGLYSLLVGLAITGKYGLGPFPIALKMVKPEKGYPLLTTHYPFETVPDEELVTFRGPVELIPAADDPAKSKCVSCMMCVKSCPSGCLTVVKGDEGKAPKVWRSDFTLCSLCGTCVEVCPADALRFSHDIYWAATKREDMVNDLLAKLIRKEAERKAVNG